MYSIYFYRNHGDVQIEETEAIDDLCDIIKKVLTYDSDKDDPINFIEIERS